MLIEYGLIASIIANILLMNYIAILRRQQKPPPKPPPLAQNYIDQIKKFEGFSAKAFWDYSQWSIGYGTRAKTPQDQTTEEEATRALITELEQASSFVTRKFPNLPPGIHASLTDLTFNDGPKWAEAGLGAALRDGDMKTASEIFLLYDEAGGHKLKGLADRRAATLKWWTDT